MMKTKILYLLTAFLMIAVQSCKDDLQDVKLLNSPNFGSLTTEAGISQLAKGGVFINGFGGNYNTVDDGLGTGVHILVYGIHDSMGDVIYIPWGNNNFKYIDNPTDITLDDGSNHTMPIGVSQPYETKLRNSRAYGATNGMLIEWTYMYYLNNVANILLENAEKVAFSGDAATKLNTVKAWAYFWKGYAYSRIGSMYIAGLVVDEAYKTNGDFFDHDAMIAAANENFDKSAAAIALATNDDDYTTMIKSFIPEYCLHENGAPTQAAFLRNINTMKARNLIANKRVADMTAADWNQLKTLAANGIKDTDGIFVIKTFPTPSQSIIDPNFGAVGPYTATNDPTYFVSEKLIQDYRPGDDRFANNFDLLPSPQVNRRGRGLNFGTRYYLVDGGNGVGNAFTYVHTNDYGADNHFMAGSYEENELMKAEAEIQLGNITTGVSYIDNVRDFQGANLAPINPASTKAEALEDLRRERRCALVFRGLAFYDARRNGVIDDKSKGGGRAGCVVLSNIAGTPSINTNAFINYNYLSYWDVPQNELEFNEPVSGSAPVVSPE